MTTVSKVSLVALLLALPYGLAAEDATNNNMMGTRSGMMGYGQGMMPGMMGYGGGMMMGYGPGGMMGYGRGGMMGYGPGMMGNQPCDECGNYHQNGSNSGAYRAISEKEARDKFDSFVAKHLKGYSMGEMNKQNMPMGTMYWVLVKDKNGNEMELQMNPWGYIMGPFVH